MDMKRVMLGGIMASAGTAMLFVGVLSIVARQKVPTAWEAVVVGIALCLAGVVVLRRAADAARR